MSDVGSPSVAPANLTSADLHACRLLLQRDLERAKDQAYRQGFRAGIEAEQTEQLEEQTAHPPHSPFSPRWETAEGAKTLLKNIGSTLLVGWMFQFFIPFLEDWPTALVVLEVVRGPLKVGGDFAYTSSLSRPDGERVPLRKRLQFCAMYACVLALFSVGASLLTQVSGDLFLQLTASEALKLRTVEVSIYDLVMSFVLALLSGVIALYLQGFVIALSVRLTETSLKRRGKVVTPQMRASWLTTRRSYVRMFTNYFVLFALATL